MKSLLHVIDAEVFKLLRKRRSYLLASLWWLLLPALTLIIGAVVNSNMGQSFLNQEGIVNNVVQAIASPFGIAQVALTGPAFLSPPFYIIVVALFAALLIGEERGHHMWKTVLVAQPARWAVLYGKLAVAMLAVGVLMAGALLFGVVFGAVGTLFLPTDFSGAWGSLIGLYLLQWLFAAALVAFAFLMVHLARNVVVGLVLVFFLPGLLEALYGIYRSLVGFQPVNRINVFFQTIRLRQTLEDLPAYFFTANVYAPARSPASDVVGEIIGEMGAGAEFGGLLGAGIQLERAVWVVAAYTAVFLLWLTWRFLRGDIE